jgi:DNA-binding transcriptional MerR regulator
MVTIGEFSTMTRLTRKALRVYQSAGLLLPAETDEFTGYRYYDISQVGRGRTIRRLRDLDMPIADVASYLTADDEVSRHRVFTEHLERLEDRLDHTREAVEALRSMMTTPIDPVVEMRTETAFVATVVTDTVTLSAIAPWWNDARDTLTSRLHDFHVDAVGVLGADFDMQLFSDEKGTASLWYPVDPVDAARQALDVVPYTGARYVVAVHRGPDARIDETYAALGEYVSSRDIGATGPVRERYLAGVHGGEVLVTEIGWPVRESA